VTAAYDIVSGVNDAYQNIFIGVTSILMASSASAACVVVAWRRRRRIGVSTAIALTVVSKYRRLALISKLASASALKKPSYKNAKKYQISKQ